MNEDDKIIVEREYPVLSREEAIPYKSKQGREWVYQITARHFVAAFVWKNDCMWQHAPIIKYMKNWDFSRIKNYCLQKGWNLVLIEKE